MKILLKIPCKITHIRKDFSPAQQEAIHHMNDSGLFLNW
ncbi:hypothetical protein PRO82_002253 [Candidatus Protochlamydia amoebophila]|nr:hypothetical protein [Candidatus Protochlamydia amoebophila]